MHDIRALRETPEPYVKGWDAKGLSGSTLVAQITDLELFPLRRRRRVVGDHDIDGAVRQRLPERFLIARH